MKLSPAITDWTILLLLAPLAASLSACSFSTAGRGEDTGLDTDAVLAAISDYQTSGDFEIVSANEYPSEVAAGSDIRVWVSKEAAEAYGAIDPGQAGSGVTLPEGAIIVREVLSESGAVKSLTLMGKGPSGYNPDLGDWWFGVASPDGTLQVEEGAELIGRLDQCYGCHTPRSGDDYLFGVPAAAQGPGAEPSEPAPEEPGPVCGDFICDRPAGEDCLSCASDCFCAPEDGGGGDGGDGGDGDDGDGGDDGDDGDGGDGGDGEDVTPPEFGGLERVDEVAEDECALSFQPATDDVSAPEAIVYDVFAGPRDEVDLSVPVATLDDSQLSSEAGQLVGTVSLTPGERHDLIVRARDEAGNSDPNTREDDCDLR